MTAGVWGEGDVRQGGLAFLANASNVLASSLDYNATLAAVARLCVPDLADWCTVDLIGPDGLPHRVEVAHAEEELGDLLPALESYGYNPDAPHGMAKVIRTGEPEFYPEIPDALLSEVARDEKHEQLIRAVGMRSGIVVPLVARGRIIGALTLVTARSGRVYNRSDLAVAERLAERAALAVDNARLFREVQDAEHRLRTLVQGLEAVFWEADPRDLRFTFVSQGAEALLGYPVEAWLEPGFWPSLAHPDDWPEAERLCRLAASGHDQTFEYRATARAGHPVWLRVTAALAPEPGPEGRRLLRGLMVDINDAKLAARHLEAQYAATRALAESSDLEEAGLGVLEALCRGFDWDIGSLLLVDEKAGAMTCRAFWHAPGMKANRFETLTRETPFARGFGLPGIVWATGETVTVVDIDHDERFLRASAAAEGGIRTVMAFPILSWGQPIGAMEFLSTAARPPDEDLRAAMETVGTQIAQYLARRRADAERRFQSALLESQSEATIDGILVVGTDNETILFHNHRLTEVAGIPEEVFDRRSAQAVFQWATGHVVQPGVFLATFAPESLSGDDSVRAEVALRNGQTVDVYTAPLTGPDGASYGRAWYVRDITESKRAEQALFESRERFRSLARTLQQSLLPPSLPRIPGIEVAARYRFAGEGNEVGGDFYDFFQPSGEGWAMVIGDVCGKGPDAAAVTALARYTIRAAAMHETRPTRVLETLNEAMLEQQPERPFCTIGYGRVQPGPGGACLTVASAGHPLPLVLRADGRVESLGRPGTILGVFPDVVISDDDTALRAGDAVVFYTDGVTEARGDGDIYGDERLVELLAGAAGSDAAGIADRIEQSVLDFEHGAPRDDMAVLVLRVSP